MAGSIDFRSVVEQKHLAKKVVDLTSCQFSKCVKGAKDKTHRSEIKPTPVVTDFFQRALIS